MWRLMGAIIYFRTICKDTLTIHYFRPIWNDKKHSYNLYINLTIIWHYCYSVDNIMSYIVALTEVIISWEILKKVIALLQRVFRVKETLWWFRLKDLSIDEMIGAWYFGCLSGPLGFTCWISFAPVFSFIYCWVRIFALSPCYILIYMF